MRIAHCDAAGVIRISTRVPKGALPIVYDAVLELRRRGLSVYRAGPDRHELDGAIVPTSWLLAEARNRPKAPVAETKP